MWTNKREAALRQLWADGNSASQCAKILGNVTRNAVIGKVHRLQLPRRRPTKTSHTGKSHWTPASRAALSAKLKARATSGRDKNRNAEKPAVERPKPPPREVFKPAPEHIAMSAWAALPDTTPVSMMALTQDTCRWPIGDDLPFQFCGCPVATGSSYCPTHRHRSTGKGTPAEQHATRSAAVIAKLEVKNGFRSRQAGQQL